MFGAPQRGLLYWLLSQESGHITRFNIGLDFAKIDVVFEAFQSQFELTIAMYL